MLLPAQVPKVNRPACPATVVGESPGTSAKGTLQGCSSRRTSSFNPEPSTRAKTGGCCLARLARSEKEVDSDMKLVMHKPKGEPWSLWVSVILDPVHGSSPRAWPGPPERSLGRTFLRPAS